MPENAPFVQITDFDIDELSRPPASGMTLAQALDMADHASPSPELAKQALIVLRNYIAGI